MEKIEVIQVGTEDKKSGRVINKPEDGDEDELLKEQVDGDLDDNDEQDSDPEAGTEESIDQGTDEDADNPDDEAETEAEKGGKLKQETEKRETGAEKRIASLTAKLKAKDEELAEARQALADREKEIAEEQEHILKSLPELNYNGKSIYTLDDDQFLEAVEACYAREDLKPEDKKDIVGQAREARKQYKKAMAPVLEDARQISQDAMTAWTQEWVIVRDEILAINPELEKHIGRIDSKMQEEFQARKTLVERLKRGPVEKFKYALDVMRRLGIDHEIEKADYAAERPAPGETIGKGKGTVAKTGNPKFTREEIAAMSLADFEKYEKDIDAAYRAKKIQ